MTTKMDDVLSKCKRDNPAIMKICKVVAEIGSDGLEAIPAILDASKRMGALTLMRSGEDDFLMRAIKATGPQSPTVAIIYVSKALEEEENLMNMQNLAGFLGDLIDAGGDAKLARASAEVTLARVRLAKENKSYSTSMSIPAGVDADEALDKMSQWTIDKLTELLERIDVAPAVTLGDAEPQRIEFINHAPSKRVSIFLPLNQVPEIVFSLISALESQGTDLSSGDAVNEVLDASILKCPACGDLGEGSVAYLCLAAKDVFKPGVIADSVTFSGPNVATLTDGQCPRCKGFMGILTFDPQKTKSLASNRRCFIATACCGSASADEVTVLCQFRDGTLLRSAVGRAMVETYYRWSPPIADMIDTHPLLQKIVRSAFVRPLAHLVDKWSLIEPEDGQLSSETAPSASSEEVSS